VEDDDLQIFPLHVIFSDGPGGVAIEVLRLGTVMGSPAKAAHALRGYHDEDRAEGREAALHRYMRPPCGLATSKDNFRAMVTRVRTQLADYYRGLDIGDPPSALLIENKPQKGYRLDPTCIARDR
jgi:hypothetical protein